MDFVSSIEQLSEIGKYLIDQANIPDLSNYYPHCIIGISILLFVYTLSRFIRSKRAAREYIDDGVCLQIDFVSLSDKRIKLEEILSNLYHTFSSNYKEKFYFSLEILRLKAESRLFLFLPRMLYLQLRENVCKDCNIKVQTEPREHFISRLGKGVSCLQFELEKDFVYPLGLKDLSSKSFSRIIDDNEWLYIQLLCRPKGKGWLEKLDRFIAWIKTGKNPAKVTYGCRGGGLSVLTAFFTLLGDTLTSVIHGSSTTEKQSRILSPKQEDVLQSVQSKRETVAFESALRIIVGSQNEERRYFLLDEVLSVLSEGVGESNSYVISNVNHKLKSFHRNEILLAHLDKQTVDILTKKEISNLLNCFV